MKIKEISEMSTDELADEEARSAAGKSASAFATAERTAGAAKPAAFAAARGGQIETVLSHARKQRRRNNFYGREPSTSPPPHRQAPRQLPPRHNRQRGTRKTRTGEVISSGMNKTIVVRTVTRVPHPKFGKIVKQMKKFYAHDEENKGEARRHRSHHGNAAAEQAEAVATGGSRQK
jgi:hypothetical protein